MEAYKTRPVGELAKEIGCTAATIFNRLNEYGILGTVKRNPGLGQEHNNPNCINCNGPIVRSGPANSRRCRPCDAKKASEWRAKHPEYYLEHRADFLAASNRSARNLRKQVLEHYGTNCACCGESHHEFLAIDHINGGGTAHRLALSKGKLRGAAFYQWLRREGWPSGFRSLCHNCNQSLGSYGYCPHGTLTAVLDTSADPESPAQTAARAAP